MPRSSADDGPMTATPKLVTPGRWATWICVLVFGASFPLYREYRDTGTIKEEDDDGEYEWRRGVLLLLREAAAAQAIR